MTRSSQYKPTQKERRGDTRTFCVGIILTLIGVLIAWQLNLVGGAIFAALMYARTGSRLCQRVLVIRSQLGPLTNRDTHLNSVWFFIWPAMWIYILHDDFPIMTGPEAKLVQSSGITGVLEQAAAASRWSLGDENGYPRRRGDSYQVAKS